MLPSLDLRLEVSSSSSCFPPLLARLSPPPSPSSPGRDRALCSYSTSQEHHAAEIEQQIEPHFSHEEL